MGYQPTLSKEKDLFKQEIKPAPKCSRDYLSILFQTDKILITKDPALMLCLRNNNVMP